MDGPSPWKRPFAFGSALGVLTLANAALMPISAAIHRSLPSLFAMAGIALFVLGAPVAAALAVRVYARDHRDHSPYELTLGQGAGVGARTGLVTTAYLIGGVVLGLVLGTVIGGAGSGASRIGASQFANVVGTGIGTTACSALCYGLLYAGFGAAGGAIGALIFRRSV